MMSVHLRGHAFVVVAEGAEAGAVLEARVGDDVDDVRGVAQLAQLFEREEAHAGEIGFHAQHAIEFDGMADGFVNLQAELRAFEDDVALALRALRGLVQRHGFFGDALRVADQVERFDQFVAGELVLAAEAIGIGALLNFVAGEAGGHDARAGLHLDLMDARAERGGVPLLDAAELHGGFGEGDALDAAHLCVGGEQQIELALERNLERILDEGILPGVDVGVLRDHDDVGALGQRGGAGDGDGLRGAGGNAFAGEPVGGGEAPGAVRR